MRQGKPLPWQLSGAGRRTNGGIFIYPVSGGHGEKFSRRKEAAIIGLLTKPTLDEAAAHAGISGPTLWRWLQDPAFQEEYRKARRQSMTQAIAQIQKIGAAAVLALKEIIEDVNASTSARVAAAKTVLEMGIRGIELEDLAKRVEELERALESARSYQARKDI